MDDPRREDAPTAADPTSGGDERTRRRLLAEIAGTAGVAATAALWLDGLVPPRRDPPLPPTPPGAPRQSLSEAEWRTLEAACDRLLPSEGPRAPGARDVNAIGYLDALLALPDEHPTWRGIVRQGAAALEARARRTHRSDFASLSAAQQDALLQAYERFPGTPPDVVSGAKWIRVMLAGILEAFFCDPVRGGNPGEIAWAWAGHTPSFPRPTEPGWLPHEKGA